MVGNVRDYIFLNIFSVLSWCYGLAYCHLQLLYMKGLAVRLHNWEVEKPLRVGGYREVLGH